MSPLSSLAECAAAQLGCRPSDAAYDEVVSTVVAEVWRFDCAHPDASDALRQAVANRRAVDALRRWSRYQRSGPTITTLSLDALDNPRRISTRTLGDTVPGDRAAPDPVTPLTADELMERFPVHGSKSRHHARNVAIIRDWLNGDESTAIGARYGVHVSRVSQITRHYAESVRDRHWPHLKVA